MWTRAVRCRLVRITEDCIAATSTEKLGELFLFYDYLLFLWLCNFTVFVLFHLQIVHLLYLPGPGTKNYTRLYKSLVCDLKRRV